MVHTTTIAWVVDVLERNPISDDSLLFASIFRYLRIPQRR